MTWDNRTATASTTSTSSADNETATAFQITNVTLATISTGLKDLLPNQTTVQIWIPYVVLTIFLLLLVALSFIRFHRGRVVQNKQRMEAIADGMEQDRQMALLLEARDSEEMADEDYLGVHKAPWDYSRPMSSVTSPGSPYVPTYLDAFLSFSQPSSPQGNLGTTTSARERGGDRGRFVGVASMVAAGKRLARTLHSSKTDRQPTRSFCYNDNGSMVDLRCKDHADTFQRRGRTLPELVVIHGPEVGVGSSSRLQRQNEVDCWSVNSTDPDMARSPRAQQLLSPLHRD